MNNTKEHNPLICDIETGSCEMPDTIAGDSMIVPAGEKPVKIIYFTDPICSSCWGIEPQLRKLKLEYGNSIEIDYRMGGLLPDWSYNSGGISKPSDVARHWDEVSLHYDMPIDGDVWLEDPLSSSYPPSIAFKAAQMQSREKAIVFLRKLREMLFLEKKNITKWEHVAVAAEYSKLDVNRLKKDYESDARKLFEEDLALARKMGVRGFPTMFFADREEHTVMVYGYKPYTAYEEAVLKLDHSAVKKSYDRSWAALFLHYPTLTVKEFSVLSDLGRQSALAKLEALVQEKKLKKTTTKNGDLYTLVK